MTVLENLRCVRAPLRRPSMRVLTLDRYSHVLSTLHAKAMARLDAVLGAAAPAGTGRHKGSNRGSPAASDAIERARSERGSGR